jgi:hypothetical protein
MIAKQKGVVISERLYVEANRPAVSAIGRNLAGQVKLLQRNSAMSSEETSLMYWQYSLL